MTMAPLEPRFSKVEFAQRGALGGAMKAIIEVSGKGSVFSTRAVA
jgi:hypothetical protein